MEKLGERPDCRYIRAVQLLRKSREDLQDNEILLIDGLDEVAAVQEGDSLHHVLAKLNDCCQPRFVISCRSVEWNNVTGQLEIAEDYGKSAEEVFLEPFTAQKAVSFLSQKIAAQDARRAINKLDNIGLSEFYQIPLQLDFVSTIVSSEGEIPETKAALYESAVSQLRREQNDRHRKSRLADMSKDQALDAAGVLMAVMLITGKDSIVSPDNVDQELSISSISDFVTKNDMKAVLGSNLFRVDATRSDAFLPFHRSIAEFLGARWLSRQIEKVGNPGRLAKRLFSLITVNGSVPASLRGLHAWFTYFNPERLGDMVIKQDPYGVLRYGDGDHLTARQAERIIEELEYLADYNPSFRKDGWHDLSLKGLDHEGLADKMRDIIQDRSKGRFDLRSLILKAVTEGAVATRLTVELKQIMFDVDRTYHERNLVGTAFNDRDDLAEDIPQLYGALIDLGDEDSLRLVCELLGDRKCQQIDTDIIAKIVVTVSGVYREKSDDYSRMSYGALEPLSMHVPIDRIEDLLAILGEAVNSLREGKNWWDYDREHNWSELSQFCIGLITRRLEHDLASVKPEDLWQWLKMVVHDYWSARSTGEKFSELIMSDDRLRQGIQRLALFISEEKLYFTAGVLHDRGISLTEEDIRLYLSEIVSRNDPGDREHWRDLVSFCRGSDGYIKADIRELAAPYAESDPDLQEFLYKKRELRGVEQERQED
ncbi:MAG: hypothetical protein CMF31_05645 [Kordiimonas sp.]|nr:hypothetical protein [Kordiimonas sp.]